MTIRNDSVSNVLSELQQWFASNCNSDWEHTFGCRIGTLDNPGWFIEIDVEGTRMESVPFEEVDARNRDDADWVYCKMEDQTFKAFGGPSNLTEMIEIFLGWVKKTESVAVE